MNDQSKNRIKSAMVVYELERALGRYIKERSIDLATTSTGQEILKRSGVTVDLLPSGSQARVIVEHSYLGEIVNIACSVSTGSSDEPHLEHIRKLANSLDLFEIRNAVSHPNRPFPECYWYRCATIAADPAINSLNLYEVAGAFQGALSGNINEPPEEWIFHREWMIPATLPEETEHSLTGLIGRTKDCARLLRELKNARTSSIAVVARGGVGKTSLTLQVLSDFLLSADCTKHCDALFFVSLKQEKLTASGVEILSAPASIDSIKQELLIQLNDEFGIEADRFEDGCATLSEKRIWLFVDNLETVLRDEPNQFNDFNDSLPERWRVIVTSRIPVDNAKNITIDVLDEQSAFSLAKQYFNAKGYESKDVGLLERISKGCKSNPLAIRLTIDLYLAGKDISDALLQTDREVTAFSFANLLDNLSNEANQILEALFVIEHPNRGILCDALNLDMDSTAAAISELSKTSLINRSESQGIETYQLGAAIHELLRTNPRNAEVRSKLLVWAAKCKIGAIEVYKTQQERNTPEIDPFYVPDGVPASLIGLAKEVKKAFNRKRDARQLVDIEGKVRAMLDIHEKISFINRLYARILQKFEDLKSAEIYYKKAIALDEKDPAPRYGLINTHHKLHEHVEVAHGCDWLINNDWGSLEKSGDYAKRVWFFYLQSLNFLDRLDEVFSKTQNWEFSNPELVTVYGVARASAYRRLADKSFRSGTAQPKQIGKALLNAAKTIEKVIELAGFVDNINAELKKLTNEFGFYCRADNFEILAEHKNQFVEFMTKYKRQILLAGINQEDFNEILKTVDIQQFNNVQGKEEGVKKRLEELRSDGYTITRIKNVPKAQGFPNFLFSGDDDGLSYFIHVDTLSNRNWKDWVMLEIGSILGVKYRQELGKAARTVTEAIVVN